MNKLIKTNIVHFKTKKASFNYNKNKYLVKLRHSFFLQCSFELLETTLQPRSQQTSKMKDRIRSLKDFCSALLKQMELHLVM